MMQLRLGTRSLGKSDLRITKVGVGTAPIGSTPEWRIYWGPQDEKAAIKTIQTAIEESWTEMQRLINDGKVRHGGLSNHPTNLIERALKVGPVVSSQNQYNPLQRQTEREIFPFCLEHGIGVLGWGSLSEGVLADNFDIDKLDPMDFRRRQHYAQPENHAKVQSIRKAFRHVADAHRRTMTNAVIAWELMRPALTGAIIGVRNENEAREMMGGANWKLTPAEMSSIQDVLAVWEGSRVPAG